MATLSVAITEGEAGHMQPHLLKPILLAVFGVCYASLLLLLGLIAAGAGHGSGLIIVVTSAPLIYTQNAWMTFLGTPIVWGIVGGFLGAVNHRVSRAFFVAMIFTHYASLTVLMMTGRGDLEHVNRVLGVVIAALVIYALGQLVMWGVFIWQLRPSTNTKPLDAKDFVLSLAFFCVLCVLPGSIFYGYIVENRDKNYEFEVEAPGHAGTVRLARTETAKDFPTFDDGKGQGVSGCAFAPDSTLHCVRPLKFGGELCTWTRASGKFQCVNIPQPQGFLPKSNIWTYFDDSAIWVNHDGDQFIRWILEGNGDHALALRRRGADAFTTARVNISLVNSKAICSPDGTWHLVVWGARGPKLFEVSVYAIDAKLQLTLLGSHHASSRHVKGVLDAAFAAKDRLHIIWGNVEARIQPGSY